MATNDKEKLSKAYALFIEGIRAYIVSLLFEEEGDKWPAKYVECLTYDQKEIWDRGLRNSSLPETMIDYHHLKSFAIKNRELLKKDFQKKAGDVPNWMGEIATVRHDLNHYKPVIDEDEAAIIAVASGHWHKAELIQWLEDHVIPIQPSEWH